MLELELELAWVQGLEQEVEQEQELEWVQGLRRPGRPG